MVEQCFILCQPYCAVIVHVSFVEKPLQDAYESSLVFVSCGGGAACAVSLTDAVIAVSGGNRNQHLFA